MSYYDVYTTLSLGPSTPKPPQDVCDHVKCTNNLEDLKKALWKRPSRADHPGMLHAGHAAAPANPAGLSARGRAGIAVPWSRRSKTVLKIRNYPEPY